MSAEAENAPEARAPEPLPAPELGHPPLTTVAWSVRSALALAVATIAANLTLTAGAALLGRATGGQGLASTIERLAWALPAGVRLTLAVGVVLAVMLAFYGLLAWLAARPALRARVPLRDALALRRPPWGRTLGFGALLYLVAVGVNGLYWTVLRLVFDIDPERVSPVMRMSQQSPLLVYVLVPVLVLVAPFVEEMVFRGVVLSALAEKTSTWWALLVSSALFGIVHLDPVMVFPTAVLGLAMGVLFVETRSLWSAVAMHGFINGIAVAAALGLRASGVAGG